MEREGFIVLLLILELHNHEDSYIFNFCTTFTTDSHWGSYDHEHYTFIAATWNLSKAFRINLLVGKSNHLFYLYVYSFTKAFLCQSCLLSYPFGAGAICGQCLCNRILYSSTHHILTMDDSILQKGVSEYIGSLISCSNLLNIFYMCSKFQLLSHSLVFFIRLQYMLSHVE